MATSALSEDLGKEELLVAGIVTGTLEQYKDLLNSLEDVDMRGMRQRTLLYVAVCLGKVDWVEGLLEMGANPGLRDGEGVSVMELAQGLADKYPEHEDRLLISKLVRLVMIGRESVAQGGCNTASTCQDAGMEAMGQGMMSGLSRKMASMCESMNDVQSRIATIDVKVNDIQSRTETIDTLREDIMTNCQCINDIKTGMAAVSTQTEEIIAIRISVDDVKTELVTTNTRSMQELAIVRSSIDDVKTGITTIITQWQEMATIRNSIDDVRAGLVARDVLLSALETSVTSLVNKERPVGMTPKTSTVPEEVLPSTPRTEEEIRRECVEAMVLKTSILNSNEGKVTKTRGWYEKLYSECDETAFLFKFLKSHDDVTIEIDFDSNNIGGMKSSFTDHDGVERKGSDYRYFADFEEKKVYLGGGYEDEDWTIGCLAGALAQMSMCLAFNNGGRPYSKGDDVTERQMKNALKEAEDEYRRNGMGVDLFIYIALRKETQRGKEVHLTSAVSSIIARDGSTEGTSELQRQVPSLLELFRDSVMPALLA